MAYDCLDLCTCKTMHCVHHLQQNYLYIITEIKCGALPVLKAFQNQKQEAKVIWQSASNAPRTLHAQGCLVLAVPEICRGSQMLKADYIRWPRQRITFRATLIFHLIDGLFYTTAAHEVRRAGVLTRGSRHLERSARPHPHRGWSCQVPKTAEITLV